MLCRVTALLCVALVASSCAGGGSASAPTPVGAGPAPVDTTSPPADPAPTDAPATTDPEDVGGSTDAPATTSAAGGTADPTTQAAADHAGGDGEPGCVEGPGDGARNGFVWDGTGVLATDGRLVCIPVGAADWQEVCTAYGCFERSTLAHAWPGGTDGYISDYRGYEQVVVADSVETTALDPLERAARWAATGVVRVMGGRCDLGWRTWSPPVSGFLVAEDLVLTGRKGLAPPGGPFSHGDAYGDCDRSGESRDPLVRTFAGWWATGPVVASDGGFVVVRLERASPHGDGSSDGWGPWSDHPPAAVLPLADGPPDAATDLVAIHHPHTARRAGGWHLTRTRVAPDCGAEWFADVAEGRRVVADLYADDGSVAAPVVDAAGSVVGVVDDQGLSSFQGSTCPGYRSQRSHSTLGRVSRYLVDSPDVATLAPAASVAGLVGEAATATGRTLPTSATVDPVVDWPANPAVPAAARFELVRWGTDFTESGFPVAELANEEAFRLAVQATLAMESLRACPECDPAVRTTDFTSLYPMCTAFAVSTRLVLTNEHCIYDREAARYLEPGDPATFVTSVGQRVEGRLVGSSGREDELLGGDPEVDGHNGDVALFRTTVEMGLRPAPLVDSDAVAQYDPVVVVGHPFVMTRSGPWVVSVGSVMGHGGYDDGASWQGLVSTAGGSSGGPAFDLRGRIVGQVGAGSTYAQAEVDTVLPAAYVSSGQMEVWDPEREVHLQPAPFALVDGVPYADQPMSGGASADRLRMLVEYWAPGELP